MPAGGKSESAFRRKLEDQASRHTLHELEACVDADHAIAAFMCNLVAVDLCNRGPKLVEALGDDNSDRYQHEHDGDRGEPPHPKPGRDAHRNPTESGSPFVTENRRSS